MNKCVLTRLKSNDYKLQLNKITAGEVLAIINALNLWKERSAVANDVLAYLRNAVHDVKGAVDSSESQTFLNYINSEISVKITPKDD